MASGTLGFINDAVGDGELATLRLMTRSWTAGTDAALRAAAVRSPLHRRTRRCRVEL